MKAFEVEYEGVSQLLFGKHISSQKLDQETDEQFEQRTWKDKAHVTSDGEVFIPPFALKKGLVGAAQWLGKKIKGQRGKTYTKRFDCGLLVVEPIAVLCDGGKPATIDDLQPLTLYVDSKGNSGAKTGSKRVDRIFPVLNRWTLLGKILVVDDFITEEVLKDHLEALGTFGGFGSMRVQNGGMNGRCALRSLKEVAV